MDREKQISRILIAAVLVILALYAGIGAGEKGVLGSIKKLPAACGQALLESSQETYLTGLTYMAGDEHFSLEEWACDHALRMIPLGSYVEGKGQMDTATEDRETYEMILANQANDENSVDENGNLIGEELAEAATETSADAASISMEQLSNYEYLVGNFYTVDGTTMTSPEELNAQTLLSKNMTINTDTEGPKVLIYHTHSQEAFADSVEGDTSTTIMGMGAYLTELLNSRGIETVHHEGVFDLIDGQLDRSKAYQLAEPEIQKILAENPSIEVVIDLHRDGVAKTTHLVTEINGKQTAQIMFFNGLSRTKANGDIAYLANPYIQDNLAFSLQMQLKAAQLYPGFTRHIYLKGYRYNMHLMPKTLLIEAGAQTNTVEEMRNAMELLADTLDNVLTP